MTKPSGMILAVSIISIFLSMQPAFTKTANAASSPILTPYLQTQEALAADQLKDATTAAGALSKAAKAEKSDREIMKRVSERAEKISKADSLEIARKEFKLLSDVMVNWAKKTKPAGVQGVRCTMYSGDWLQKPGEVRNPYYGKSMLTCGEPLPLN